MRRESLSGLAVLFALVVACGDRATPHKDAMVDPADSSVDGTVIDAAVEDAAVDAPQPDGGDAAVADGSGADAGADQGPTLCTLVISTINGRALDQVTQINSTLDKVLPKPGFQVDVGVKVFGAANGKAVTLAVTGASPDAEASSEAGIATFPGVTVNSSFSTVVLEARAAGCQPSQVRLDVQPDPTCTIAVPADGATLTVADDKIDNDTFETDVVVDTDNRAIGGVVRLELNGRNLGTENVTPSGQAAGATFEAVIFSPGQGQTLKATLTLGQLQTTCEATIEVDVPGPACEITALVAPPGAPEQTSQGPGLGPDQDSDTELAGLQTTISVVTDGTASTVTLRDGTSELGSVGPADGAASFAVTLDDGPHVLTATCTDGSGASNQAKANVLVDVTKPTATSDLLCFTKCLDTSCPAGDPALSDNRRGKITCTFGTADGTGSAVERYLLRYRVGEAIDESNWDDAQEIILTPRAGVQQSHLVGDSANPFRIPFSYSFALRAVDVLGNTSDISNLPAPAELRFRTQVVGGGSPGDKFGSQAAAGDFNCDGFTDVAIGESSFDGNRGRVRIFQGSVNGMSTTVASEVRGTSPGGLFGVGLARLDFNGDGCDDLAVRANRQDEGRGRVYLYLGRDTLLAARTDIEEGTGAEAVFSLAGGDATAKQVIGQALAGVDLDGDGLDELALTHWDNGDANAEPPRPEAASVLIDYGDTDLALISGTATPVVREMPAAAELLVEGGKPSESFGLVLARGGLLDPGADTQEELLIGARKTMVAEARVGAVYVFKGADRGSDGETLAIDSSPRIVTILGDAATEGNSGFGYHVAGLGNIDGDDTAEFAVSDIFRSEGGEANAGKVYIFNLKGAVPQTTLDARATLSNGFAVKANNLFGRKIANGANIDPRNGADINGDSLPDVLVGSIRSGAEAAGSVHVFLGQFAQLTSRSTAEADTQLVPVPGGTTTAYSVALTFLGDVNGDGFIDIIVGDPSANAEAGQVAIFD